CSSNPRDHALVAQERMEAPRLARADLCERVGAQTQSFGPEVFQLRLRLFGSEQPDAGTLLRAGLGEDELGAALELEPKCRDLRSLLRSEEHTSELQSPYEIVCRLLLEKKNTARSWDA